MFLITFHTCNEQTLELRIAKLVSFKEVKMENNWASNQWLLLCKPASRLGHSCTDALFPVKGDTLGHCCTDRYYPEQALRVIINVFMGQFGPRVSSDTMQSHIFESLRAALTAAVTSGSKCSHDLPRNVPREGACVAGYSRCSQTQERSSFCQFCNFQFQ